VPGRPLRRMGLTAPKGGNGSWDQFGDGNSAALVHGVRSEAVFSPVAEAIAGETLGSAPEYLGDVSFRFALRSWAEAEAQLLLYESWMEQLPQGARYTARGAQAPPVDLWRKLSAHAANLRKPLGLDPVSRVRIGQSLASQNVDLARLAMMEFGGDQEGDDG
jgi:hypothetical protein